MESAALMEPMLPEESNRELEDLAFELTLKGSALAGTVNPIVTLAIGSLVRSMNCYYSNLIEGHDTHPSDIERALRKDFSSKPQQRALQHEAVAHIELQKAIDEEKDGSLSPTSVTYIKWLHKEFCGRLPDDMLWVESPSATKRARVIPGELRGGEVQVGRHIPPTAKALPRFLERFEEAYNPERLSKVRQVIAIAAAHHRFLWIHPFYDGNGRVARLMSHSMFKRIGIGSSLWSAARGLARDSSRYKELLMAADERRHSDLDGRANLSQEALVSFCKFFLEICLDQVQFMHSILQPSELMRRLEIYSEEEVRAGRLPKGTFPLLRESLLAGEFDRGEASPLIGRGERMARMVISKLLKSKLLVSNSPRGPLRLGFPLTVVERWFPSLYPGSRT